MSETRKQLPVKDVVCGLDLGFSYDFTALIALERSTVEGERPTYEAILIQMIRRLTVPSLVARLVSLVKNPKLAYRTTLVVERNQVGPGVIDPLYAAFRAADSPARLISGMVTAGDTVNRDGYLVNVPKRDLVAAVSVVLETERIKIPRMLARSSDLEKQLRRFTMTKEAGGRTKFGADLSSVHDDLVMAAGWALWWGENNKKPYVPVLTAEQQIAAAVTSDDPNYAAQQYWRARRKFGATDKPLMVGGRFVPQSRKP